MRHHFSAEALALHREGAVSPRKAGRITAHLSTCAQCTEVDTELAAVPAVLAATSLPPMPETLFQRVQMAIVGEAQARVMASAAPGTAPSGADVRGVGLAGSGAGSSAGTDADEPAQIPGRPDLPERRRGAARRFRMPGWSSPLVLRGLAATGAVVLIAGAGLLLAHGQNSSENGSGSGSAGVPAQQSQRRPAPAAGRAAHAPERASGPISLSYHLKGRIATARALTSRENFTRANMATLVHKAVAGAPPFGKGAEPGTTPGTTSQRATSAATFGGLQVTGLAGCLTGLAGGRTVLVADIARFLGRPATIVVLKPLTGSHLLDVVVVALDCSQASPDIIAQVTVPAG